VIAQTFYDLMKPDERKRNEVIAWMDSDDFDFVCSLAQLEPDDVRNALEEKKLLLTAE